MSISDSPTDMRIFTIAIAGFTYSLTYTLHRLRTHKPELTGPEHQRELRVSYDIIFV